jgi:hypothetical protein
MTLMNYTTTVPVRATIEQIQRILVSAGAHQILTEYGDKGMPIGIAFSIVTPGGPRQFSLPVNADAVQRVLKRDRVPPRYASAEHAQRVAWRILKDWMEAQLAIVRTEMVALEQVMLPYMHGNDGRTVYEVYRDQQFGLPQARPAPANHWGGPLHPDGNQDAESEPDDDDQG